MGNIKKGRAIISFIAFSLILVILYIFTQSAWVQKRIFPIKYEDYILKYSDFYELDPYLIFSIIWVESKFEPQAKSSKDARGLMQITPGTGKWIAEKIGIASYNENMLYKPDINIRFGCWYLNFLSRYFNNDLELILASYNGGIGNVVRWLNDSRYSKDGKRLSYIPFKETTNYLMKVLKIHKKYMQLYEI